MGALLRSRYPHSAGVLSATPRSPRVAVGGAVGRGGGVVLISPTAQILSIPNFQIPVSLGQALLGIGVQLLLAPPLPPPPPSKRSPASAGGRRGSAGGGASSIAVPIIKNFFIF